MTTQHPDYMPILLAPLDWHKKREKQLAIATFLLYKSINNVTIALIGDMLLSMLLSRDIRDSGTRIK